MNDQPSGDATEARVAELSALHLRIQELEGEKLAVAARERARIRQELHDGLSQHLGGVVLLAKALSNALTSAHRPEAEQARELTQLIYSAVTQTRALMDHLAKAK